MLDRTPELDITRSKMNWRKLRKDKLKICAFEDDDKGQDGRDIEHL
jgi:hypothetical protein